MIVEVHYPWVGGDPGQVHGYQGLAIPPIPPRVGLFMLKAIFTTAAACGPVAAATLVYDISDLVEKAALALLDAG